MSTPKWKKDARMAEQLKAKEKRIWDKKYGLSATPKKPKVREFVPYTPAPEPYYRETPHYKSLSTSDRIVPGSTAPAERKVYTGERRLLGIATMHKSNMVPIFEDNKEEAKEIARMRR